MAIPQQPANDLEYKLSELMIHDERLKGKMPLQAIDSLNHQMQQPHQADQLGESSKDTENDPYQILVQVCQHFVRDMNNYGISVTDSFLGSERGNLVYEEVIALHKAGLFQDGQLVRNDTKNKEIRGDEILWLSGNESHCPNITYLINEIDQIVMTSNKLPNNGKLGKYRIDRRTKAMVACYPGNGSQYVKHVDNPNKDGRVLTAIYYLNKNWTSEIHGGMLRIFPNDERKAAADIAPTFDRMLFFWSDRRNPHEVQPAFRTRYAITIWYFDAEERVLAQKRNSQQQFSSDEERKARLSCNQ